MIIGVGQLRHNRERDTGQALEPLELVLSAIQLAVEDVGVDRPLVHDLDAIDVVQMISWSYSDLVGEIATRVGAAPLFGSVSGAGGHQPARLVAEAANRIAAGESRLAVVCGGEAQASLDAFTRQGAEPPWTHSPGGPGSFSREVGGTEPMWDLGLVMPTRVYPLFENRLRYELGQSFQAAQDWSARMYSEFSRVAAGNEAAWNPTELERHQIGIPGPNNRMICYPYPLLMNAMASVDQAAAVILADATYADLLGIGESKRIRIVGSGQCDDCEDILERASFGSSQAMGTALDGALDAAGLQATDIDHLDIYSCFPIVPKLASLHLKSGDKELSRTGGLSSFGGPHNNYSTHSVVAMVRTLRDAPATGLVYANGEYLTKHHALVLASGPDAPHSYRAQVAERSSAESAAFTYCPSYTGPGIIETYTVEYDRNGSPAKGFVIMRTESNQRAAARVAASDGGTLRFLTDGITEPIGEPCVLYRDGDRRCITTSAV